MPINNHNDSTTDLHEPLAVIGANCQFPGIQKDIEDLDALYDMLLNEQTPIREVPLNRWDINQYYDPDRQKAGKIVSRKGGFLNDPRLFDAAFFKISAIEAKQIDPQHRLFLEVSVRALNDANIPLSSLSGSNTGVYCGLSTHEYSQLNYKDKVQFNAYTCIGSAGSAAAGRLAYFLNLKGPCITTDTACSSSFSALYLAATELRTQQCDKAIVGGVHLVFCPEVSVGLSKANMLSAVGESRSFDAAADGYVRSEGCAVIILKRLSDAIRDGDTIQAVIKSVIMNQDGSGTSLAAPNIEAQIAMHHSVLEKAGLKACDIDYIETHGTGTIRGDTVEFQAIKNIHQGQHAKEHPLVIGALKSSLGHTISASGIAALLKIIGAFKQEIIPANLHYSTPNCSIDPCSIPAIIPCQARPFPKQKNKKRVAQISNFGFTGTNVSAIIEEPPTTVRNQFKTHNNEISCFVISANSEFSLRQMLNHYLVYLKKSPECLSDICYTLINCRDHYKYRCAIIAPNTASLIQKIESGDFILKKTTPEKEITWMGNDAQQYYESFFSGANIRSSQDNIQFARVPLPPYVFDRKPYWHDGHAIRETAIPDDWCFELQWHPQNIVKNPPKKNKQNWLLIGEASDDFGLQSDTINFIHETDTYVLHDLDGIIFRVGFSASPPDDIDSHIDFQKNTLKKLLAFIKNLQDKAIQLRLIFLTTETSTGYNQDALHLDSSPLHGFCKTLGLELPQYQTTLIHLDNIHTKGDIGQTITNEIHFNSGENYEHCVCYQGGQRLVSRLQKIFPPQVQELLRPDVRYLITGGCGGLGLVTAQALLGAGAKEVVLVSRTIASPAIINSIQKIQSHYPDKIIRAVSLDITDKKNLGKLLSEINTDGLLKGIIHAAGTSTNKPLLNHQDQDIDNLFAAKVKGGWYLHELSKNYELDFFIVYSSISSVFGSNKESIYSATNSFLDALIAERQRLGLVGTAIQWGPWAEVGIAKKRSRNNALKEALIHNAQGQAFILRFLHSEYRHTSIISPAYLRFMLDFVPHPQPLFYQALTTALTQPAQASNITLSPWLIDYSKITTEDQLAFCKKMVTKICEELLEVSSTEKLDEDAGFFDMGLDSLMMAELAARVKENIQPLFTIVATIAFDYPSINQLAHYIQSELQAHFPKSTSVSAPTALVDDAIAIIGMSCTFPNAPDINAFEQLLENGLSGIQEIPFDRWDNQHYYDSNSDAPGKTYVSKLGLIDHIKLFDPQFFGISPREAAFLDPQQRLFLENCYYAIENANYPIHALRGSATGVFAGVGSNHEYYGLLEKEGMLGEDPGMFSITGKALNIIPGRVAYTFDFKGPALSIDTACSSSLVAVHYACNSLKNREIDFALAGGVNILLRPEAMINLSKAKALSPDGQCKTFDETADGYVRSEGCGVLLLKRMQDALRDNDHILAVIKGSALNQDGKSAGLTVPNGKSQETVMQKALQQAQLASHEVSYIEAHGTGTLLGDPIEAHAINAVYGQQRSNDNPLYVGTVKTNIGHLESASGIAGLIKVVIGLQKKRIYKHLNFKRLNPKIQSEAIQIALENKNWYSQTKFRSAGVSAFGFSGTNAHIIIQDYPYLAQPQKTRHQSINALLLSAKNQTALDNLLTRYQSFLATTTADFNDLCYTAATCRDHHPYRVAVFAKDAKSASSLLQNGDFCASQGNQKSIDLQNTENATLHKLVTDYLRGISVDWGAYYEAEQHLYTKVTLPHYPFTRKKYWLNSNLLIKQAVSENREQETSITSLAENTTANSLYTVKWNPLAPSPQHAPAITIHPFLVISTDETRTKKVLGNLPYQRIANLDTLENIPDKHIIFLHDNEQFYNLFRCCQKMVQSPPASFILVTENAYAISDATSSAINPHHTMAFTFWKSFQNELEHPRNYAIDLNTESTLAPSLPLILNCPSGETQFAIRDTLYVPRLKQKTLLIPVKQQQKKLFISDATYLITGGTGGLAKHLIEFLICHGVKHIVIISRSACSVDTQKFLANQRKKDISITHYASDASKLQNITPIINQIQQSPHPLKGVFHLAGIVCDELIIHLREENIQAVLRAKMESAWILHQLTKDIALDHFVLFSSASSILGSRRQANYAAANGFLDGLAHLRHQQGLPALAINWGVFNTAGMGAEKADSLKKRGFIPMDALFIEMLDVLLRTDLPQIVLCPMQWDIYFKNTPKNLEFSEQNATSSTFSDQSFLSFLQQQPPKLRTELLSQALCEIAADVLDLESIEQLNKKNDLFAMGMDSLMSLELRNRVQDKLQCPTLHLPIEYFINDPRVDKITNNIAKELEGIFAKTQQHISSRKPLAGATTISDTQYGFWIIDKMGVSFNCPKQIQFHGKLNSEYLYKALAFTVHQNGAFWLNFHKKIPLQMLKRQGDFIINYQDISANYNQEALNQIFYDNTMQHIPLSEQPLIRVYLYKLKEDLHELHIIIPHIIFDESSSRSFFEQFKNNYTQLKDGKSLTPIQEEYGYLEYVQQKNNYDEKNLQDKVAFWKIYNTGFQKLSFGRSHHLADAAYQEKNLFQYPLNEQLVERFKVWHQEKNMNVSAGLITAFHIVFYKLTSQQKIPILVLHNGRENTLYKSVIGLFIEYKRINITCDSTYTFSEFLKSIENEFIKTAPFQKCSQFIKNAGLKEFIISLSFHVICLYHKLSLSRKFKVSHPDATLRPYYLKSLSKSKWLDTKFVIKDQINQLLRSNFRLLKPHRLTVVFNIAAGFFIKQPRDNRFADLDLSIPNHYGAVERCIGNQTLWIYFTKDQYDQYQLSINGPLTKECKDLLAREFNQVMTKIMENDTATIHDLI